MKIAQYGYLTPDCGEYRDDEVKCGVCGETLNAERNVEDYRSVGSAYIKKITTFDRFRCPNLGEDWHKQILALYHEIRKTPSNIIENLLNQEIEEILKTRKTTKKMINLF